MGNGRSGIDFVAVVSSLSNGVNRARFTRYSSVSKGCSCVCCENCNKTIVATGTCLLERHVAGSRLEPSSLGDTELRGEETENGYRSVWPCFDATQVLSLFDQFSGPKAERRPKDVELDRVEGDLSSHSTASAMLEPDFEASRLLFPQSHRGKRDPDPPCDTIPFRSKSPSTCNSRAVKCRRESGKCSAACKTARILAKQRTSPAACAKTLVRHKMSRSAPVNGMPVVLLLNGPRKIGR
jgi:hypothetical protein